MDSRFAIEERPAEHGDDIEDVRGHAPVGAHVPSAPSRLFLLLAGGIATAAALGVLRLFRYLDCQDADWSDWFYDDAVRASLILGAGEIVFLSLVVPRLTQDWVRPAGDAPLARFPARLARRLAIAAGILLVVSEHNLSPGPSALKPQLAAAGIALLAASVSVLLWSFRGSVRGAGMAALALAALPCLVEFARNAPHDLATSAAHPRFSTWCGPAWWYPLFIYCVLRPSNYLPILGAVGSLVALLAARLAWTRGRQPAGSRTSSTPWSS